jgi:hypothetical protein
VTAPAHDAAGQGLLPLLETGDLHEDDYTAVLADHLPDLPAGTDR